MKILFSLIGIFVYLPHCVHSQEAVDTVSVRVQYRVKYNERNMKLRDKDTNIESIGDHVSASRLSLCTRTESLSVSPFLCK